MQLDQIPLMKKTIPGISTCLGPGLVTREGEDRHLAHFKNLEVTALLPRKDSKKQLLRFSH